MVQWGTGRGIPPKHDCFVRILWYIFSMKYYTVVPNFEVHFSKVSKKSLLNRLPSWWGLLGYLVRKNLGIYNLAPTTKPVSTVLLIETEVYLHETNNRREGGSFLCRHTFFSPNLPQISTEFAPRNNEQNVKTLPFILIFFFFLNVSEIVLNTMKKHGVGSKSLK